MQWPHFRRQPRYLGLDLGTKSIKAALYARGRWQVASVPAPREGLVDTRGMVAAIAEAATRTGWRGSRVVTAVTGERVFVRYLRLPRMTPAELKSGMAYELESYLPPGTGDMVTDWTILDSGDNKAAGQMLVLLAAAPREQVARLYELCRDAGLDLAAIDLVPLALCRALAGETGRSAVIIDIGNRWSNLVLVEEGRPLFSRTFALGGEELGRVEIAGSNHMAGLVREIGRSLEFYRSQGGHDFNPERLLLTGGGAQLEGVEEYCREELGLPVTTGIPGAVTIRPGAYDREDLTPVPGDPALAVAMGLALWEKKK